MAKDMLTHSDVFTAWFFLFIFIVGINLVIFFMALSYNKLMYFDLNLKYLEDKKSSYVKTDFFQIKRILRFYGISWWFFLALLVPVVIFIIGFLTLVWLSGWINQAWVLATNNNMFFTVSTFVLAIITGILFIYISYRFYFWYVALVDTQKFPEYQKSKKYLEYSYTITKGWKKLLKLVWLLVVFALVFAPYTITHSAVENTYRDISNYELFLTVWEESKMELINSDPYYYQPLVMKYKDISLESIQQNKNIYYYWLIFLNVLGFLVITGIMEMVMVSFYKRELQK
jgi:hypothetical protein